MERGLSALLLSQRGGEALSLCKVQDEGLKKTTFAELQTFSLCSWGRSDVSHLILSREGTWVGDSVSRTEPQHSTLHEQFVSDVGIESRVRSPILGLALENTRFGGHNLVSEEHSWGQHGGDTGVQPDTPSQSDCHDY